MASEGTGDSLLVARQQGVKAKPESARDEWVVECAAQLFLEGGLHRHEGLLVYLARAQRCAERDPGGKARARPQLGRGRRDRAARSVLQAR